MPPMLTRSTRAKAGVSLPLSCSMMSSRAEEGRAEAAKCETHSRAKMRYTQWAVAAACATLTPSHVITPTPEGAKGWVYLLLFNARNIPATIVETAIYEDTLAKTPQGWKLKKAWSGAMMTISRPSNQSRFRRRRKINNEQLPDN